MKSSKEPKPMEISKCKFKFKFINIFFFFVHLRYMLKRIDPIYRKLGFNAKPEDTHLDILLRKEVVRLIHLI